MVYIGTTGQDQQGIYLDMHAIDRDGNDLRVSAIVGDGTYEGEVLIESGQQNQVTFADAWLGGEGLGEFLQRCGQAWLESALLESIRTAFPESAQALRPHSRRRRSWIPERLAESGPVWRVSA